MTEKEKKSVEAMDTFFGMVDFMRSHVGSSSFLGGLPDDLKETENELRVMNNNFKLNDLAERMKENKIK